MNRHVMAHLEIRRGIYSLNQQLTADYYSMTQPKIQLLIFDGCPLADAARTSLQTALASLGLRDFEEINILDAATPNELKGWGSPTILVEGEDLTRNAKGEGVGCRVYNTPNGVPSPQTIAKRIRSLTSSE